MLTLESKRSSRQGKKTVDVISVTLNEHELRFNGRTMIKLEKAFKDKDEEGANLFACMNDYIESVFDTQTKVDLFKEFEKAHNIIENGKFTDYEYEMAQLKPIIINILNLMDVERYCGFIQYSKYLVIPKDLSIAASKGDYPVQTTVTDADYVELVKMAFVVRSVFPIIFGLIHRLALTMGATHAEKVSGELIKDNPHLLHLYGWKKLQTYIDFTFNKRGIPSQVDDVSSVEHFTDNVLFNTLFSRLCVACIPETEEGKNIATAINAAVKLHETGGVKFRPKEKLPDEEDDKRSTYERYQVSESVKSANEVAIAEFFSFGLFDEEEKERHKNRFHYQAQALGIKHVEMIDQVYDNLSPNWLFDLKDHNLKILQLTFIDVCSPFIYMSCDHTQLMACIAIAQVYLHERGYQYLPSIIGATENPRGVRFLADALRLNAEDKDYITSICDIQTRNNEGRSFNEALVAATEFLDNFGNGVWQSNLEYGILSDWETYKTVEKGRLFELDINVEIKNEFMRLIREANS